jgi:predicted DNA-binding protein (UPF0251 family)
MVHAASGLVVRLIGSARKAKTRVARDRKNERDKAMSGAIPDYDVAAERSLIDREQAELLHDEIERLPREFRLAIVLCYLEGLPLDEAARRLRWREGTLRSRLARAREKLRRGLTRRGMVLPAAALASVLDTRPASASPSCTLWEVTTKAAIEFAAGQVALGAISTSAMALAREVLRSMIFHKLKLTLLTLLFIGTIAGGAGFVGQAAVRQAGKPDLREIATKPDDANPKPAPGRMFVLGRVLDPQGKPVPNATLMAYARLLYEQGEVAGQAQTDQSGRFRLDVLRTSSDRHEGVGAATLAPGNGVGWVQLDPDAHQLTADISLRPEQVIHGRLFDLQGQPARSVTVSVSALRQVIQRNPDRRREQVEGPIIWRSDAKDLPGWPLSVITDSEGRFTMRGIGRDLRAFLTIHDPRYAQQDIEIETDGNSESKHLPTSRCGRKACCWPTRLACRPSTRSTTRTTLYPTPRAESHSQP